MDENNQIPCLKIVNIVVLRAIIAYGFWGNNGVLKTFMKIMKFLIIQGVLEGLFVQKYKIYQDIREERG